MVERPDRDRDPQVEPRPLPGEVERERADISVVSILAVLALIVAGGLWFFTKDQEMVAGDGTTVKQTTGSGAERGVPRDAAAPGRDAPVPGAPQGPAPTKAAPQPATPPQR